MYPILFRIGGFELRSYGVVVALAFFVAYVLAKKEAVRKGIDPARLEAFASSALLFGLLGARLYYIAFFDPQLLRRPLEILAVWKGGLALHGSLLAGLLVGIWFCRRHKVPFWKIADTLAPSLILGQAIGRIACFLNGDAYGKPTDLPWAATFTDPHALAPLGIPLHPTQLYEFGLDLLLFGLLWAWRRRIHFEGQLFLMYVLGYGAIRFFVENFRGDQLQFMGGFSVAQTLSLLILIASAVTFLILKRRAAGPRR